jgi:capsular polysaccharide biosynthesis protein
LPKLPGSRRPAVQASLVPDKVTSVGVRLVGLTVRPGVKVSFSTAILRGLTAGDVYRALWRHKLVIVLLTTVFVVATWYATIRQAEEYEASTLIRVQERGPDAGDAAGALQAAQSLALTYAKIVDSGALRGQVKAIVARCSRYMQASANATAQRGAEAPDSGPSAASVKGVAAQAHPCGWFPRASGGGTVSSKVSATKLSADPAQDLPLLTITARSKDPTSATVAAAAAPVALRGFIRRTGPSSEEIVTVKAARQSSRVSRHLALNVTIALMVGLIFNGALALLLELFRDRLPEPEELGHAVGHPVLATIPTLRFHRSAPPRGAGGPGRALDQSLDRDRPARVTGPRIDQRREA